MISIMFYQKNTLLANSSEPNLPNYPSITNNSGNTLLHIIIFGSFCFIIFCFSIFLPIVIRRCHVNQLDKVHQWDTRVKPTKNNGIINSESTTDEGIDLTILT